MLRIKSSFLSGERLFLILPLALSIFGLLMIFEASSVSALRDFGDKFYYLKYQAIWLVFSLGAFFFFSFLDFRFLRRIALPFFMVSLFFLLIVLLPGVGKTVYGGRRWIWWGAIRFQPAELAKLSLIIYLSTLLEKKREFLPLVVIMGLVLGLLLLEPDLGTAIIIIGTAFSIYFVAGAPWWQIGGIVLLSFILAPILILVSPYRRERFFGFLKSAFSAQGAPYHVRQILLALGAGGVLGRGLGQSRQKFLFLPEVTTDSIFAIIAEEFGFLGAAGVILLFMILMLKGLKLAILSKDPFAQKLVVGVTACLGLQTIINLSSIVALIPLTGVPLPFISYGGSSLLVTLSGMGIVYNCSRTERLSKLIGSQSQAFSGRRT